MARKLPTLTDEQRKAWKAVMNEEMDKRLKIMRERQAYFSAIAEEYETFEEFIKTQKMWLEIMGIELYQENPSYLSLRIQLDYQDYETYHIVKGDDGKLTVSDIFLRQDLYGGDIADSMIFTLIKRAYEIINKKYQSKST